MVVDDGEEKAQEVLEVAECEQMAVAVAVHADLVLDTEGQVVVAAARLEEEAVNTEAVDLAVLAAAAAKDLEVVDVYGGGGEAYLS
ncbi:hypothetical protein L484_027097 [Morus notabilis]|uniref:Uncharacterized protein n=1 Tax=Morus notabilis TaxID=981085 RepID=W9S0W9_9ROSA|nr:hypothetical protein L484_027097 [Morus notabilis]